jgi:acyl carrier protein
MAADPNNIAETIRAIVAQESREKIELIDNSDEIYRWIVESMDGIGFVMEMQKTFGKKIVAKAMQDTRRPTINGLAKRICDLIDDDRN